MRGRVTGIGGLFFRAEDPDALAAWYAEHLGVPGPGGWTTEAGMTVFAPFPGDTEYWPRQKQWMLNLRVVGLDDLIRRLTDAAIAVETRPEEWDAPATGRFARIHDPEGNPIELWEPPGA